jgi:hypothetical protein
MSASIQFQGTSVDAFHAMGNKQRSARHRQILDVMQSAHARGESNLTTSEIVSLLNKAYPDTFWHPGNASARINELTATDGPLVWCDFTRLCTVSGSNRQNRPLMLRAAKNRAVQ